MTVKRFEELLKKINSKFNIKFRARGYGGGVYSGNEYIARIDKGELYLHSLRTEEGLKRRGRIQLVAILLNYGWIKPKDKKSLLWGI